MPLPNTNGVGSANQFIPQESSLINGLKVEPKRLRPAPKASLLRPPSAPGLAGLPDEITSITYRPEVEFQQLLRWLGERHNFEVAAARQEIREQHRQELELAELMKRQNETIDIDILAQKEVNELQMKYNASAIENPKPSTDGARLQALQQKTSMDAEILILSSMAEAVSADDVTPKRSTSSRTFPRSFNLRIKDEWKDEARPNSSFCLHDDEDPTRSISDALRYHQSPNQLHRTQTSSLSRKNVRCPIHPSSSVAAFWSSSSFLVVLIDLMLIPLQVFKPPRTWLFLAIGWSTQLYWNVDLCASFFFGYYDNEQAVMDPRRTVKHYLTTWFSLDVLIVSLDWVIFGLGQKDSSSAGFSRFGKTLKALKFLRLIRLLKTAKVMHAPEAVEDFFSSDIVQHFTVVKMLVFVLILNHLVACIWYGIGDTKDGTGWVEIDEISQWSFFRRYSTAYHWSLTQLGVGESNHMPNTLTELIFANIVLIIGIVVFSSIISGVTNSVAALHERKSYQIQQLRLFRKFCKDHQLPPPLSRRVRIYLEHKLDRLSQKVQQDQITMFQYLSEPLLAEINESMYLEHLQSSLFLSSLYDVAPVMVRKIAFRVVTSSHLGKQDILFSRGEIAFRAFVVFRGEVGYVHHDSRESEQVFEFQWVSHAVLWLHSWLHTGNVRAVAESELLCIESRAFLETVRTQMQAWDLAHQFAKQFYTGIAEDPDPSDLYDLDPVQIKRFNQSSEMPKFEVSWVRKACCWWRH